MDLREILFAQFPAFFLLSLLFLIAHLRVRKTSAVKSVLWVILFGAALAASVVCCFLGIQAELWTLKTLITLGFWSCSAWVSCCSSSYCASCTAWRSAPAGAGSTRP